MDVAAVAAYLTGLQERIVGALEAFDGKPFLRDEWTRPQGGGGVSRLIEAGDFFERGGVNFSHVMGAALPPSATAHRPELAGRRWEALGVSLVLHPRNPYCPTSHMNVRFFVAHPHEDANLMEGPAVPAGHPKPKGGGAAHAMNAAAEGRVSLPAGDTCQRHEPRHAIYEDARNIERRLAGASRFEPPARGEKGGGPIWWFGGGMDLTPYYGFEEDCVHFHRTCRDALAPFGTDVYARYKRWCDEYFFLKHRNEPRGIGGIFFDDLNEGGFARCFALTRSVGDAFLSAYLPICEKRRDLPHTDRERDFQLYRRGRYVEFNLVWDRGTLFGLQSGGRTEAILMSLPPVVKWRFDWHPEPGSPEEKLYTDFLPPRDWLAAS